MKHYNFLENIEIKSKEELNQVISDEDIIRHYFGEFQLDEYYISPRGESTPSLVFDYYGDQLQWRDFGRDVRGKNAVEFVIYIEEVVHGRVLSFYEAVNKIYREVPKGQGSTGKIDYKKKKRNIALKFRKTLHPWELDYWTQHHVTEEQLKKFKVCAGEVWCDGILWHRSEKNDPCFIYLWSKTKEIWKAYRPNAPEEVYRDRIIKKKFFANNTAKHVQGFAQLPEKGKVVFITKGYKDVICLDTLNIPAVAPHSESMFIEPKLITNLKERFEHIYVAYDNDKTGIDKSIEYSNQYELNYWNVPHDMNGKDPADIIKNYSPATLLETIREKLARDNIKL